MGQQAIIQNPVLLSKILEGEKIAKQREAAAIAQM
jgi:hypothetical protein